MRNEFAEDLIRVFTALEGSIKVINNAVIAYQEDFLVKKYESGQERLRQKLNFIHTKFASVYTDKINKIQHSNISGKYKEEMITYIYNITKILVKYFTNALQLLDNITYSSGKHLDHYVKENNHWFSEFEKNSNNLIGVLNDYSHTHAMSA